jgi:peroxiredoxin
MKKIIILLLSVIIIQAKAQDSLRAYSIKGTVSQLPGSGKVYIRYAAKGQLYLDSTVFADHQFSYKGKVEYPVKGSLTLKMAGDSDVQDDINIYLEGGVNFVITGTRNLSASTIQGGRVQADADARDKYITDLPAYQEMNRLSDSNKVWIKTDRPKAIAASTKIQQDEAIVNQLAKAYYMSHPDSYMTLAAANNLDKANPLKDTLYTILTPRLKNTYYGKKIKEALALASSLAVGMPALEFQQPDTAGKEVSLSSFRGKYVLVDFWASWCAGCREENPNVVRDYALYKGKNFTVISISLDNKASRRNWIRAIAKDGLTWTQVSDLNGWNNQVAKLYGINFIPQNYLVDPNGIIIGENLRGEELNKKLASIFN